MPKPLGSLWVEPAHFLCLHAHVACCNYVLLAALLRLRVYYWPCLTVSEPCATNCPLPTARRPTNCLAPCCTLLWPAPT